jgi:hypothetical protein
MSTLGLWHSPFESNNVDGQALLLKNRFCGADAALSVVNAVAAVNSEKVIRLFIVIIKLEVSEK